MQNIFITGRLTEDAVAKSSIRQGIKTEFVTFSVACNEDRGDERSATFYNVTMSKTKLFEYLKKGQMVAIIGRFRFLTSEDEKKNVHYHLNVSVMDIQLLGSGKKADSNPGENNP